MFIIIVKNIIIPNYSDIINSKRKNKSNNFITVDKSGTYDKIRETIENLSISKDNSNELAFEDIDSTIQNILKNILSKRKV